MENSFSLLIFWSINVGNDFSFTSREATEEVLLPNQIRLSLREKFPHSISALLKISLAKFNHSVKDACSLM